ncbi:MAG: hypothetical protein K940chlam6_01231 [Chlamydiae bacterium]|nr:hypothetical protein [Chlamydiota bacterium]NGX48042.1 hypothetical protein [Chlamydiota bacterium]
MKEKEKANMNPSQYLAKMLLESFLTDFKIPSWSTASSMSFKVILKSVKKILQKSKFLNIGMGS